MVARRVKRSARESASIQRQDRHPRAVPKTAARRHAEKSVGAAQAVEGMRFLAADRREFFIAELSSDVMRPIAVVVQIADEDRIGLWQQKLVVSSAHQAENCRPNKKKKGDERRNGIPRKSEDRAIASPSKQKWFSRLHCDSPQIGLGANRVQARLDQIPCTDRNAAEHDQDFKLKCVAKGMLDAHFLIRTMPNACHRCAASFHQRLDQYGIAIEDLSRA